MIVRYLSHAKEYGFKRLITSTDILVAAGISIASFLATTYFCPDGLLIFKCDKSDSIKFVESSVSTLAPITSVILTGLAILVSFTGGEFLARIRELEGNVFSNILFMFEHTVILSLLAICIGLLLTSYQFSSALFYLYLFLFLYTLLSIIYLIQLLVNISLNKAEFEKQKHSESDD